LKNKINKCSAKVKAHLIEVHGYGCNRAITGHKACQPSRPTAKKGAMAELFRFRTITVSKKNTRLNQEECYQYDFQKPVKLASFWKDQCWKPP
jgi:hypothetical protein